MFLRVLGVKHIKSIKDALSGSQYSAFIKALPEEIVNEMNMHEAVKRGVKYFLDLPRERAEEEYNIRFNNRGSGK